MRYEKVQAARDLFYMDTLLQIERETMDIGHSKLREIFTVRRNRNAALASEIKAAIQSSAVWKYARERMGLRQYDEIPEQSKAIHGGSEQSTDDAEGDAEGDADSDAAEQAEMEPQPRLGLDIASLKWLVKWPFRELRNLAEVPRNQLGGIRLLTPLDLKYRR